MDQQQQLVNYISTQLQSGQSPNEVFGQLTGAGWPADQVQQAFLTVQAQTVPTHMQVPQPAQPVTLPQAEGKRRGRIRMGWRLLKHSVRLLNSNRYLMRYFAMTWAVVIAINAALIAFFILGIHFWPGVLGALSNNAIWYPFAFLSYLVIYCVINFYAAALAGNILDIYKGQRKPYKEYVTAARAKFGPIFFYSLIAAVIGIVLEYTIEKLGKLGRIISWLIGTAWSISTMFVLPIIMDTETTAPASIKQSLRMVKKTWGEGITAKVTVNTPLALIQFAITMGFGFLLIPVLTTGLWPLIIVLLLLYLFVVISIAVIGSFANSVINVALYYYAIYQQVPPGFSAEMLNHVMIKSKRRLFKKNKQ